MQIVDFAAGHIGQAARIAKQNYEMERENVPALPPVDKTLDLMPFAENGLGVAAVGDGELLGFLCCWKPRDGAFSIPGLRLVFSPMGANGTVLQNRSKIYARLYQAAGAKWAKLGASCHGICLYAHDMAAQTQFFRYGFGMRTVDAIRGMDTLDAPPCETYTFSELAPEDVLEVLPLEHMLDGGYIESPFFMYREPTGETEFLKEYRHFQSVYFVARHDGRIVAFIRAELDGETFIQDTPGYLHCKGLYCLPEHRGKGVSQKLLDLLLQKLKSQGYSRLGVDYESINPSGTGFWLKYFGAYTYGVVRRIDERGVGEKSC